MSANMKLLIKEARKYIAASEFEKAIETCQVRIGLNMSLLNTIYFTLKIMSKQDI